MKAEVSIHNEERQEGANPGEQDLNSALALAKRRTEEFAALLGAARAILKNQGFKDCARAIFDECKSLIGATAGYVALLDEKGAENKVLFLDSGGLPCGVDPALPMPIRGLRAEAYHSGTAVLHNDFAYSTWSKFLPGGHVTLTNVLFAPLMIEGKAVGLLGLANKPAAFTENDRQLASAFGELAAIALRNSLILDQLTVAVGEKEKTITQLKDALARIKTLNGMLPICASCKKIRDDKGYWSQLETYISEHTEAEFTHCLCNDCLKKLYPTLYNK